MEWSDLKVFLALAESGSIRRAAKTLKVSHSTVSRRIQELEKQLNVRLFDRLPGGYRCTSEGENILQDVKKVEHSVLAIQRQVMGQDSKLSGDLRVTLPDILATDLLMPDIVAFNDTYPDINLELIATYNPLNLNQREADVAIRITDQPPDFSVGRCVGKFKKSSYASINYINKHQEKFFKEAQWIGWGDDSTVPDWTSSSPLPQINTQHLLNDVSLQLAAARAGMGIAMLPCFLADQYPELHRVPENHLLDGYEIWLITHIDLRSTKRVKEFMAWMINAFEKLKPGLDGNWYQHQD